MSKNFYITTTLYVYIVPNCEPLCFLYIFILSCSLVYFSSNVSTHTLFPPTITLTFPLFLQRRFIFFLQYRRKESEREKWFNIYWIFSALVVFLSLFFWYVNTCSVSSFFDIEWFGFEDWGKVFRWQKYDFEHFQVDEKVYVENCWQ